MLATDPLYISPEDYLAAEAESPIRHEYRDGEVFAMTGGTQRHSTVILNVASALKSRLRGSGCRTFAEGMKVRVEASNSYYYPDVVVTCSESDRQLESQFVNQPHLIVEVLSPSTARFDRTEKFADYRAMPSVMEIVFISTERALVEVFRRGSGDFWEQIEAGEEVVLASASAAIGLDEIYEETDLLG
ncbi:MAG: Uma2 family endonuclease [Geitlerinemataceae cyanobacterium]